MKNELEIRYRARVRIEADGREMPVLPRSKKRTTFDSISGALKALEIWGRRNSRNAQGRVLDTEGNLITTIGV